MSFPRYERYKDSGVEWLGEVPERWQVTRLKNTTSECRNGVWGADASGISLAFALRTLIVIGFAFLNQSKLCETSPNPSAMADFCDGETYCWKSLVAAISNQWDAWFYMTQNSRQSAQTLLLAWKSQLALTRPTAGIFMPQFTPYGCPHAQSTRPPASRI
jgi:hypothetical protein